jgi:hypothetical protein
MLAMMRPLPCVSWGGLGWGCPGFSAQLTFHSITFDGKKLMFPLIRGIRRSLRSHPTLTLPY